MLTLDVIVDRMMTKAQLVETNFPMFACDTALPQAWLNDVAARSKTLTYHEILCTTVWVYPTKEQSGMYYACGIPGPMCQEMADLLDELGYAYWTQRGYHGQPETLADAVGR